MRTRAILRKPGVKHQTQYGKLIYIVLAVAFGLYLTLAFLHRIGGYGVETDFYGSYAVETLHILHGQGYHEPDHGPGYPVMLIPFYLVLRDLFWAGKLLTILSAIAVIYLSYKLFENLFSGKLAFLTSILLAINLTPFAYLAGNDLFFAALAVASVYLIYRGKKVTSRGLLLSGLVAGYAFMTRLNAIVLPVWLGATILLLQQGKWSRTQKARSLALFLSVFVVAAGPWLVVNLLHRGNPFATDVYQTIGAGMGQSASIAWAEEKGEVAQRYHGLLDVLLANPGYTAKVFLRNTVDHFQKSLFSLVRFPAYLFVVPGLLMLVSLSDRRQLTMLLFPLFGFLIYCILPFMSRFYLYILPFFLLPVAYSIFWFDAVPGAKSLGEGWATRWLTQLVFALTALFLFVNVAKATAKQIKADPVELLRVSESLRNQGYGGGTIVARKPHLGFVSGMDVVYFPEVNTVPELVDYARSKKAQLVLYSAIEAELRPQLEVLGRPEKVSQWLRLIYKRDNPSVMVYLVKDGSQSEEGTGTN